MAKKDTKQTSEAPSVSDAPQEQAKNECPVPALQHEKELAWLLEKARVIKPTRIIEIGSLYGGTLWHWMQLVGKGGQVVVIDQLVSPQASEYALQRECHEKTWKQWAEKFGVELHIVETGSTYAETIGKVHGLMPEADLLFIDGDHDYEYVRSDFINYGPRVRQGGIIAFHDISPEPYYGSSKFWMELKNRYPTQEKIVAVNRGIGVIVQGYQAQINQGIIRTL